MPTASAGYDLSTMTPMECAEQCEVLVHHDAPPPPAMVLIQRLWSQAADNDNAVAFLVLVDRLGLTG